MTLTSVETSVAGTEEQAAIEGRSPLQLAWARLRQDRVAIASAVILVLIVLIALFAPLIASAVGWSPTQQDRATGISPEGLPVAPGSAHWFGTDNLGRDILVRTVYGARVSLLVGVVATVAASVVGVVVGTLAGYFGGWVDVALARLMDVVLSFPFLLFAIALVSIVGPSLAISVGVIAFFSWASFGRIVRGQTLSIRQKEYIEAARSLGAGDLRIMVVDVLPNLVAPVIVLASLLMPTAIVFEATLSFLGLGVVPPTPTWGNMLADSLQFYSVAWWFVVFPGVALLITTLTFNLLGDGVRDALDPSAERLLDQTKEGASVIRFLVRRTVFGILVLWLISVATFLLFFVAPHDPARVITGRLATPETVALVRHRLGLDQPVLTQYGHFLNGLIHGNLGYSFYNSTSVNYLIVSRLPPTVSLALGGAIIWLVTGVLIGVLSATRARSLFDRVATIFVLTGLSMPTFLLGLLLIYLLFFRLHLAGVTWFPAGGYVPLSQNPAAWAQHMVLPWITIALVTAATYTRLTRSSLLETLSEDYIRTARAKGLSERRVIYRHGLRSAMTPVVTQFGIDVGTLLGGVIVTETVFGLGGLGQLAVQSVTNQDLPVIIGIVLLAAFFIVVSNLIVDALYAVLDPRVRLS